MKIIWVNCWLHAGLFYHLAMPTGWRPYTTCTINASLLNLLIPTGCKLDVCCVCVKPVIGYTSA